MQATSYWYCSWSVSMLYCELCGRVPVLCARASRKQVHEECACGTGAVVASLLFLLMMLSNVTVEDQRCKSDCELVIS